MAEHEAAAFEEFENDSKKDQEEAMPQLPDGIGMSFEDVRALLAMKHETTVSMDDPVMMLVTLFNAYLAEMKKIHNRHNEAVTNIMASQSAKYIDGVKATSDALGKTLADSSVKTIKNIFDSHASALLSNKINAGRQIAAGKNNGNIPSKKDIIRNAENISTAKPGRATTEPRNLSEQLFWQEVKTNPANGKTLPLTGDSRFPEAAGFKKMQATHKLPDGSTITIHYQYNSMTKKAYDMKIVLPEKGH